MRALNLFASSGTVLRQEVSKDSEGALTSSRPMLDDSSSTVEAVVRQKAGGSSTPPLVLGSERLADPKDFPEGTNKGPAASSPKVSPAANLSDSQPASGQSTWTLEEQRGVMAPEMVHKEKLIKVLKKEVKLMMEESVMLKCVHEDSSCVNALAAIVDTCLSFGLKRRALGLFKTSSTTALIQKLAKEMDEASLVAKKVTILEQALAASQSVNKRPHSTGDSCGTLGKKEANRRGLLEKANSGTNLGSNMRFIWIKVALFEKVLHKIVCYLVHHCDRFYTKESLLADQDYGPILGSLLVGPCALEFTKVKPPCQSWSDLPANELVQRHKISSCGSSASNLSLSVSSSGPFTSSPTTTSISSNGPPPGILNSSSFYHKTLSKSNSGTSSPGIVQSVGNMGYKVPTRMSMSTATASPQHVMSKRPLSQVGPNGATQGSSGLTSPNIFCFGYEDGVHSVPSEAREYVESLHQNQWDSLIYGKNNVHVLPKDGNEPVPGYLSLHQPVSTGSSCLKWTPNRLMNGSTIQDKNASWQQAIYIDLESIQFIHCHQAVEEAFGTVILISLDGTQHPPLQFPAGGHLIQFLTCIETCLLPHGMLEPPLWSERRHKEEGNMDPSVPATVDKEEFRGLQSSTILTDGEDSKRLEDSVTPLAKTSETNEEEQPKESSNISSKALRILPSLKRNVGGVRQMPFLKSSNSLPVVAKDSQSAPMSRKKISTLDTIDMVFKIIYSTSLSNGASSNNSAGFRVTKMGSSSRFQPAVGTSNEQAALIPLTPRSKTSEWFSSLFSPNKSRHTSSSTDTSRSFSLSDYVTGEDNGGIENPPRKCRCKKTEDQKCYCKVGNEDEIAGEDLLTVSADDQCLNIELKMRQKTRICDSLEQKEGSAQRKRKKNKRLVKQEETDESIEIVEESSEFLMPPTCPISKSPSEPISTMCSTMRRQIISRAFYGWLAHCRHLKTVRQHLGGLAFYPPGPIKQTWTKGIDEEFWVDCLSKLDSPSLAKNHFKRGSTISGSNNGSCSSIQGEDEDLFDPKEAYCRIYYGGVDETLRRQVWPFLFEHYSWAMGAKDREDLDKRTKENYENKLSDWMAAEAIIQQRDKEITATNIAKLTRSGTDPLNEVFQSMDDTETISSRTISADKISTITEATENSGSMSDPSKGKLASNCSDNFLVHKGEKSHSSSDNGQQDFDGFMKQPTKRAPDPVPEEGVDDKTLSSKSGPRANKDAEVDQVSEEDDYSVCEAALKKPEEINPMVRKGLEKQGPPAGIGLKNQEAPVRYRITTPSVDSGNHSDLSLYRLDQHPMGSHDLDQDDHKEQEQHLELQKLAQKISTLGVDALRDETMSSASTNCLSPISSEGGMYAQELMDNFALNLHRIEKDVCRCDRNLSYFANANLEKLRNIITTYVWENLDVGYMQGMCDLAAPLLVIFDDEPITHSCFTKLMDRMISNFPNGSQMDENFANMRSMIQVLDQCLYDNIQQNGDFSHFYFCYRWFLLDFKREFSYRDTYMVWETIWASKHVVSSHFNLFVALALVETYRDIILDRKMDFTDIIKFFNEMAEKHDASLVLNLARRLLTKLQTLIAEKD